MNPTMTDKEIHQIGQELSAIKRLMVLSLLREGATQNEVATALGVSQGSVSKMFPKGIVASLKVKRGNE